MSVEGEYIYDTVGVLAIRRIWEKKCIKAGAEDVVIYTCGAAQSQWYSFNASAAVQTKDTIRDCRTGWREGLADCFTGTIGEKISAYLRAHDSITKVGIFGERIGDYYAWQIPSDFSGHKTRPQRKNRIAALRAPVTQKKLQPRIVEFIAIGRVPPSGVGAVGK